MQGCQRFRKKDSQRSRWVLLRFVPLWLLFCLGLPTCGGQLGVLVDIGSWPEQADSLRVEGTLNGVRFTEPLSFGPGTTRFVVFAPEGQSGELSLSLTALDRLGCPRANAETRIELGGGLRRVKETSVALIGRVPPYCTPPQLKGITPASGVNFTPTKITLTGSGFQGGARVTVGGAECTNLSVVSATEITCSVPAKAASCGAQSVVVTNPDDQKTSGAVFTYRAGSLSFTTNVLMGTSTGQRQLVSADFNRDGKLDLASANYGSANVSIYLNDGTGGFGAASDVAAGGGPVGLAAGDLNRDNIPDLVVANAGTGNISFLAGTGTGGFAAAMNMPGFNEPQGILIGDINNDGNPDVLVTNKSGSIAILSGNGRGGLATQLSVTVGTLTRYGALADINRDGNLDFVVPNFGNNNISYRPGNGNASFGSGIDLTVGSSPVQTAIRDLNGDQSPDLVVVHEASNDVYVLLGDGKGSFSPASGSPFAVGRAPQAVVIVDVDGDGSLDILTANRDSGDLSILFGTGAGGFSAGSLIPSAPGAFGLVAGDFNGDGLMDLAHTSVTASNTTVRLAVCN